jgi:hypothetical protein
MICPKCVQNALLWTDMDGLPHHCCGWVPTYSADELTANRRNDVADMKQIWMPKDGKRIYE